MNLQTRVYVTTVGCQDREATVAVMHAIGQRVRAIAARRPGLGWQAIALADEQDFEDFDVDRDLITPVTGGRLPVGNLNVSFDLDQGPAGDPELDALVAEYGLVHVATFPDDD
jgi:hypothetical protein